jgi:hypothetical protein
MKEERVSDEVKKSISSGSACYSVRYWENTRCQATLDIPVRFSP